MVDPLITNLVEPQHRSVDGLSVDRALPSRALRMVGPFAFLDHMGPAVLAPGRGIDVRPHPHIHLSTVTYLFAGEMVHRDSLGSEQLIQPGAINWMTAGRGIVHSERTPAAARATGSDVHGLQLWVATPAELEHGAPAFSHHPAASLPELVIGARGSEAVVRVLAGTAYGAVSPVPVQSPLIYVEARLAAGAVLPLPSATSESGARCERAVYVITGEIAIGADRLGVGRLAALSARAETVSATADSHLVIIGGEPIGERFIWWNFVASKKEDIVAAAHAWRNDEFPKVPGDAIERIPLETLPHFPD